MPLKRLEYLNELKDSLDVRKNLWTSLRDWEILTATWVSMKFKDIDTKNIAKQGEKYMKIVKKCSNNLKENAPLDELRMKVEQFT